MNNHFKFNRQFLTDFWQLLTPYWVSEEKWLAYLFLSLQIIFSIIGVRASVELNTLNKVFYDALQNFNQPVLITSLWRYALMISILLFAYGYSFYFSAQLGIRWRRWLTTKYLNQWLDNHTHYRMRFLQKMDNPDQRISEDLEKFAEITLTLFFLVFCIESIV